MSKTEVWMHVKSGGVYRVSGECLIEATMTEAVIYQSLEDGQTWVRPSHEFYDGRFVNIDSEGLKIEIMAENDSDDLFDLIGKRQPEDWMMQPEFAGVTILDPDGWDRTNWEESWSIALTLEEMQTRVSRCTVQILPSSPMHPANVIKENT